MSAEQKLQQASEILVHLGMPRQQLNERTALCLLCLLDMTPNKQWNQAGNPLVGITPIMDWSRQHYGKDYAPNTRETFRRQSMHQFVDAGICLYNPDKPDRAVNSPHAAYQIEPTLLGASHLWHCAISGYASRLLAATADTCTNVCQSARDGDDSIGTWQWSDNTAFSRCSFPTD